MRSLGQLRLVHGTGVGILFVASFPLKFRMMGPPGCCGVWVRERERENERGREGERERLCTCELGKGMLVCVCVCVCIYI